MSRLLKLSLVLVVFLVGLAFHLRNDQFVNFNYYVGSIDLPFSFFMVAALGCGALLGVLACMPMIVSLKRENMKLSKQASLAAREINNLRVIPVKDTP
ncbi:MAG: LapA family protein [Gammaproteobacteria bacterium]|nr:LapA family protein [Gammaproteobacteria bacterium]